MTQELPKLPSDRQWLTKIIDKFNYEVEHGEGTIATKPFIMELAKSCPTIDKHLLVYELHQRDWSQTLMAIIIDLTREVCALETKATTGEYPEGYLHEDPQQIMDRLRDNKKN